MDYRIDRITLRARNFSWLNKPACILLMAVLFGVAGCSDAANDSPPATQGAKATRAQTESPICQFDFRTTEVCVYHHISVNLVKQSIAAAEEAIKTIEVERDGKTHKLTVTADTMLFRGDRGYVSMEDINFDGSPDLAITTSFGAANLYLDYWVYDTNAKQYIPVGNYSRLIPDAQTRTLSTEVKVSAAEYKKMIYRWQGNKLVEE